MKWDEHVKAVSLWLDGRTSKKDLAIIFSIVGLGLALSACWVGIRFGRLGHYKPTSADIMRFPFCGRYQSSKEDLTLELSCFDWSAWITPSKLVSKQTRYYGAWRLVASDTIVLDIVYKPIHVTGAYRVKRTRVGEITALSSEHAPNIYFQQEFRPIESEF
jgi:hypothetical protein